MKICFLLPGHWSGILGGAEIQVKYIMDFLQEKGNDDIYYICRKTNMQQDGKVKIFSIKHDHFLAKYVLFPDFFQVQELLKKIKPDVIYTRIDTAYVGMAAYYCKHHPCKLMWHIAHQRDVEPYKIKQSADFIKYFDRKIYNYGVKNADIIIGQARYQDKLLQQHFGRSCSAIIPNFHPMAENIKKDKSPLKIVWIANIKAAKRPEIFLQLANSFKNQVGVEFVMMGEVQDKNWKGKIEDELQQMNNFTYMGALPLEEVNTILSTSHIFVNTSSAEGFPNSFIQAWLRKVVVVSLDIDPDEVIKHNEIGYVSGNFEQLVQDIQYLITHPEQRMEMAEKGYQYAMQHHTFSNIAALAALFHTQPSLYVH